MKPMPVKFERLGGLLKAIHIYSGFGDVVYGFAMVKMLMRDKASGDTIQLEVQRLLDLIDRDPGFNKKIAGVPF